MPAMEDSTQRFDIPVVLFIFKRADTAPLIMSRVRQVKPKKVYLLADEGRNEEERELAAICRLSFEKEIDWDCEVIKRYAKKNRGVFENIGLGALRVFEQEPCAIFLEDDNLPEVSFFYYCRELLERYRDNKNVLWICGTNYLGDDSQDSKTSYSFTRSLLPCGWASWSTKFPLYYDAYFERYKTSDGFETMKRSYRCKPLFRQQNRSIKTEILRHEKGMGYRSWDYQMISSIRSNGLYGVVPNRNQIKNIGVDSLSEHGGSSMQEIMTQRFCGMDSYPLPFPLIHPDSIEIDARVERELDSIILQPIKHRIKNLLRYVLLRVRG